MLAYKNALLIMFMAVLTATGVRAGSNDPIPPDTQVRTEGVARWLDLDAASFTMRYRNSFDTNGTHIFDDIQQRSLLAGKLKLDKEGKYFVGFRAESGRYFNWSFANFSGIGYGAAATNAVTNLSLPRKLGVYTAFYANPQDAGLARNITAQGWQFYIRDLYLSATPVRGLTLEFGGIPIERGAGSEITTYDEDGYISGERVRVKYPDQLYLDQIEFTSAYLGDVTVPNFFDRYNRLTQSNYRQVLGEKHFGKRLKASADYTWLVGTHTTREAVLAHTSESRVLDTARVELYQRLNDIFLPGYFAKAGSGWALTGTKHLTKRLTIEGGYATIDQEAGVYTGSSTLAAFGFAINGDSYQVGKRFFGRTSIIVAPGVSLFGFYTHQLDAKATPLTYTFARQNMNFGMQLDFKAMLERGHIL